VSKDRKKSFFIWSEAIFESFKSGFIKKIDLNFYFQLESAAARRLYRYLDKHFYFRSSIECNLHTLAFEKIGLSRNYKYVSSIKQQLEPALDELCEKGFLSSYEFSGRGQASVLKVNSSNFKEKLPIDRVKEINQKDSIERIEKAEAPKELISLIVDRGIHINQARKLLTNRSVSDLLKIPSIVAYFDSLVAKNDKKISINPQGFLYRAVQYPDKFIIPNNKAKSFTKRPERKPYKNLAPVKNNEKDTAKNTIGKDKLIEVLRNKVEKKVSFLKGILSEDKYQEAFTKCLQEEFKKAKLSLN